MLLCVFQEKEMGGIGSGAERKPRLLVEQHHALDVYDLYRRGALVAGAVTALQWPDLVVRIRGEIGRIFIAVNGGVEVLVQIGREPANYGGDRPSFRCPVCDRRCLHLFLMDRIACRTCAGLDYASRHRDTMVHQVIRLRRQLGAEDLNPFGSLPPRPRYPANRTYDRLVARIQAAEARVFARFGQTVAAIARRHRS
jgi:hypothetical protein